MLRWSGLTANFSLVHQQVNPLNEPQRFSALARCCLPDTVDSRTGSTRCSYEIAVVRQNYIVP